MSHNGHVPELAPMADAKVAQDDQVVTWTVTVGKLRAIRNAIRRMAYLPDDSVLYDATKAIALELDRILPPEARGGR